MSSVRPPSDGLVTPSTLSSTAVVPPVVENKNFSIFHLADQALGVPVGTLGLNPFSLRDNAALSSTSLFRLSKTSSNPSVEELKNELARLSLARKNLSQLALIDFKAYAPLFADEQSYRSTVIMSFEAAQAVKKFKAKNSPIFSNEKSLRSAMTLYFEIHMATVKKPILIHRLKDPKASNHKEKDLKSPDFKQTIHVYNPTNAGHTWPANAAYFFGALERKSEFMVISEVDKNSITRQTLGKSGYSAFMKEIATVLALAQYGIKSISGDEIHLAPPEDDKHLASLSYQSIVDIEDSIISEVAYFVQHTVTEYKAGIAALEEMYSQIDTEIDLDKLEAKDFFENLFKMIEPYLSNPFVYNHFVSRLALENIHSAPKTFFYTMRNPIKLSLDAADIENVRQDLKDVVNTAIDDFILSQLTRAINSGNTTLVQNMLKKVDERKLHNNDKFCSLLKKVNKDVTKNSAIIHLLPLFSVFTKYNSAPIPAPAPISAAAVFSASS